MIKTSIIILSYNTRDLLKTCLESIHSHLSISEIEIIVVDNNSHDGSVAMVKKEFPQVHLIENKENAGFAKGCNIGAARAKGEYLLFLNSDVELTDNAVVPLVAALEKNPHAAVAGGLLENTDGSRQRSFGAFYSLWNVFLLLFGGEKGELKTSGKLKNRKPHSQAPHPDPLPKGEGKEMVEREEKDVPRLESEAFTVDWVSGGFMLVRREAFERVKGFDEHFFMYIEDMEFCYRIHQAGKAVVVVPQARITHVGHGSSNRTFAIVSIYKGLQYFYKKHKNPLQYSILVLLLGIKAALAIVAGVLTGRTSLVTTYKKAMQTL